MEPELQAATGGGWVPPASHREPTASTHTSAHSHDDMSVDHVSEALTMYQEQAGDTGSQPHCPNQNLREHPACWPSPSLFQHTCLSLPSQGYGGLVARLPKRCPCPHYASAGPGSSQAPQHPRGLLNSDTGPRPGPGAQEPEDRSSVLGMSACACAAPRLLGAGCGVGAGGSSREKLWVALLPHEPWHLPWHKLV